MKWQRKAHPTVGALLPILLGAILSHSQAEIPRRLSYAVGVIIVCGAVQERLGHREKQRPTCFAAVCLVRRYNGRHRDAEGSSFYSLTTLCSSCPHWSIPSRAHYRMLGNNPWKQHPLKAQRPKPSCSLSTFKTGLVEVLTHPMVPRLHILRSSYAVKVCSCHDTLPCYPCCLASLSQYVGWEVKSS